MSEKEHMKIVDELVLYTIELCICIILMHLM